MERSAAIELLSSQHSFPGPFEFRVVVRPDLRTSVISAMTAGMGDEASLIGVTERASRNGTYVALRVTLHVPTAERVLDVYDVLRALDGILVSM